MHKIVPNLWFDNQAEEAAHFYVSVFPNSRIGKIMRYGKSAAEASGRPEGSVLTIEFELDGNPFIGLNGGPVFQFNESISFAVNCDTQDRIDYYWEKLSAGGEQGPCGWLKDKYGVSWQIVPTILQKFAEKGDAQKTERAMKALLQMKKLDIATLERAYEGRA